MPLQAIRERRPELTGDARAGRPVGTIASAILLAPSRWDRQDGSGRGGVCGLIVGAYLRGLCSGLIVRGGFLL